MNNMTLGSTIATLRKDAGMTQLELAQKMCVTDKAVSKWERDLSCPDINTLPKLAETFNVSVEELMQIKPTSSQSNNPQKFRDLVTLVLRAVSLAMGVAVTVLAALKQIDLYSGFTLLGIGLACNGMVQLGNTNSEK